MNAAVAKSVFGVPVYVIEVTARSANVVVTSVVVRPIRSIVWRIINVEAPTEWCAWYITPASRSNASVCPATEVKARKFSRLRRTIRTAWVLPKLVGRGEIFDYSTDSYSPPAFGRVKRLALIVPVTRSIV